MSFKDIREAANTRLISILTGYKELPNIFDIEDNTDRDLVKGFAVRWGDCSPGQGPTCKIAFDSILVISLTASAEVRAIDKVAPQVGLIYDDIDTIIASLFDGTNLGVPTKLRGLKNASLAQPRLISGKKFVLIEINIALDFTIKI